MNFRAIVQRWQSIIPVLITVGFAFYICGFKILDRDYWWHLKAGELMVHSHHLIRVEPFAYTREGLPYLATHEWLAQIILYAVHAVGGSSGIILFRTGMMIAVLLILLSVYRRHLWIGSLIAIWAANSMRGGFMDRPQLFTFVLAAAFLRLALWVLDSPEASPQRPRLLLTFVFLEILWVNLHGAACLVGLGIMGALWVQSFLNKGIERGWADPEALLYAVRAFTWTVFGVALAFLVSPNHIHNVAYLTNLLTDKTIAFIGEWQPRETLAYARDLLPWWIMAGLSLAIPSGRRWFNGIVVVAMGALSLKAQRHEMLFVIAASMVFLDQLRHSPWQELLQKRILRHPWSPAMAYVLLLLFLARTTQAQYRAFCQRDDLYGWGTFDLARGAYDFLEREHIEGRMFNTYGIGGYLLYRGYPTRKVFIDGRNVDYGYDFMMAAYLAGEQPSAWKTLVERYGLTYAVVDYDAIKLPDHIPYADLLDRDADWRLVYLDDWVGIYLRDNADQRALIDRFRYRLLTPARLEKRDWIASALTEATALETELQRSMADNPEGIKSRLALAQLYLLQGRLTDAEHIAEAARQVKPERADIFESLAAIAVAQKQWDQAARRYDRMLALAGDAYPHLNYAFLSAIYQKAQRYPRAQAFARKAGLSLPPEIDAPTPPPSPIQPTQPTKPAPSEESPAQKKAQELGLQLQEGIDKEIQSALDEGVDLAQAKKLKEAEAVFLKALPLDPGNAPLNNNLGGVYYQQKDYAKAADHYRRALERNPDFAEAHYNLAKAYVRLGDLEKALSEAKAASSLGASAAELQQRIERALSTKSQR